VPSRRRPWPLHDEAFGIVIGGVGMFTLLSLLSWSHSASLAGVAASPAANWGGVVGHRLASTLVHTLGGGAFLLIGLLGQVAYLWFTHAARQLRLLAGLGGVVLLLGVEPLLQLGLAQSLAFKGEAGGQVGWWLVALLVPYCNVGGTLLIGTVVATVGGLAVARPLSPMVGRGVLPLWSLGLALLNAMVAPLAHQRRPNRPRPHASSVVSTAAVIASMPGSDADLAVDNGAPSSASEATVPQLPEPAGVAVLEGAASTSYHRPPLSLFNLPTNGKSQGNGVDLVQQARVRDLSTVVVLARGFGGFNSSLVLRRDPVEHEHFVAPTVLPVLGAATCAFLVGPWTDRDPQQYTIAGWMLGLGVVLWVLTWAWNRGVRAKKTGFRDPSDVGG